MSKYCICATVDAGLIDEVVELETAVNNVNLGWVILPKSTTPHYTEAQKSLKYWQRSPRKLQRVLDEKIMY